MPPATVIPWKDAKIHVGVVPEQERLYPLPVLLQCRECGHAGYWYPGEGEKGRIDVKSRMCPRTDSERWQPRPFHVWEVWAWNGNAVVDGAPEASD